MTSDPNAPDPRYSLEETLARFDELIEQLAVAEPDPGTGPIEVALPGREPAASQATPPDVVAPARQQEAEQTEPLADENLLDEPLAAVASTEETAVQQPETERGERVDAVLVASRLTKAFGDTVAVDQVELRVPRGTIFGIVGPNGAGKTTTLSMITGLLRPDSGTVTVNGADVWEDRTVAARQLGILPDRLLLFDRLTGRQLLHYTGALRGLDRDTVLQRGADLVRTFGLADAQDRLVSDYSVGMTKKLALAAAMIHAPRVLVLDEPFESVDTVSAERIISILQRFVAAGGTVLLSSHSMELVERLCDYVAVFVDGSILAAGSVAEVRGDSTLEERFISLVDAGNEGEDLEWLRSFSD